MQKSFLVIGGNGMLGRYMVKYFNADSLTRADFNPLKDSPSIIDWNKYDYIINCMGVIPQKPHTEQEMNIVNWFFPLQISQIIDTKFIQISSDCVVDSTVYGSSKFNGEVEEPHLTIRTSIIGEGGGLLQDVIDGKIEVGFIDHFWNGVACLELCKKVERFKDFSGLLSVATYRAYTKYELCNIIAEVYGGGACHTR